MSRIAKAPISIPSGVNVNIDGAAVTVKGPKGTLSWNLHPTVSLTSEDQTLQVAPVSDKGNDWAMAGTTRALINNMVVGVSKGYEKKIEINGVGYKAELNGDTLTLSLGYSHTIDFKLPKGIKVDLVKNTQLTISGIDRQVVGQVAAQIRGFKEPEPYKGKGVRYANEQIRRKVGKAGAK